LNKSTDMNIPTRRVLSVTFILESRAVPTWSDWCKTDFLPEVRCLNGVDDVLVSQVRGASQPNDPTYSVLIAVREEHHLDTTEQGVQALLKRDVFSRFGESCLPFLSHLIELPEFRQT